MNLHLLFIDEQLTAQGCESVGVQYRESRGARVLQVGRANFEGKYTQI